MLQWDRDTIKPTCSHKDVEETQKSSWDVDRATAAPMAAKQVAT
eukprot:CAMPEP_0203901326 /NCGR_PEP_ID=MMETSP0359-20131031/43505_1 /ASSEMBLY_ACC=CAM_ASM_000338 /TAXON_ID=268821 /ORGANISM="Scrippsiella Hangoei, Strain SHTV-5" /LENGTH=43 /DNA_ID= /DNA_START= /DNA_END= /DNA_ORIENTATION=